MATFNEGPGRTLPRVFDSWDLVAIAGAYGGLEEVA